MIVPVLIHWVVSVPFCFYVFDPWKTWTWSSKSGWCSLRCLFSLPTTVVFFLGDPGSDGTSLNQVCHQVCWTCCFENWRESYGPICRWHRMLKGTLWDFMWTFWGHLAWGRCQLGPEGYDENKSIERHVLHLHTVFCLTTGKPVATGAWLYTCLFSPQERSQGWICCTFF